MNDDSLFIWKFMRVKEGNKEKDIIEAAIKLIAKPGIMELKFIKLPMWLVLL